MLAACTKIEFATVRDAREISALSRRYIEHGLRWHYTPPVIRDLLQHRSKNVVVARREHSLVGFGIMTYRRDTANLDLLAVRKPQRQRGVGRQILHWLEKVADTAGIANIFVQVRLSNTVAIRFYEKLGYQAIAEIPGYYQGREAAAILCKGLQPMTGALQATRIRIGDRTLS